MAIFPSAVATDSDLYIAVNALATQLTDNPLTSGATTVNVVSTTGFPTVGFISIDSEIIKYTGTSGTSFTGCTRGQDGTTAASHVQNSQVFHNIVAAHHNVLKEEIKAIETNLGINSVNLVHIVGTETITGIKTFSDILHVVSSSANGTGIEINNTDTGGKDYYIVSGGSSGGAFPTGKLVFRNSSTGANPLMLSDAQIFVLDGTASLPSITFASDTNTGFYRIGADEVGLALGGSLAVDFAPGWLGIVNGTVSRPGLLFQNDPGTGLYLYSIGSHISSMVCNGSAVAYFAPTGVSLLGTNTNDSANAGYIGQYVESVVGNTTNPTSGQYGDLTSISLTAGDWDITGIINQSWVAGTITNFNAGISPNSGNNSTGLVTGSNIVRTSGATSVTDVAQSIPVFRVSLASTTTYYLKILSVYTSTAPVSQGRLSARRVR